MEARKNVIISIPLVWCIRNFLLSGISKELSASFNLYYAIPVVGKTYMINFGISEEKLLILRPEKYNRVQRYCSWILREAHRQRFPTASDRVFEPLSERGRRGLRGRIIGILGCIFKVPFLYHLLEWIDAQMFLSRIDPTLNERIESIDPTFALSTAYVVNTEWPLFRQLHAREISVYTHILSFDNLTSRGYLPIKFFDKFLVWNSRMAKELREIYGVPSEKTIVTGTPQFDFHINSQYVQSRDWTNARLGIESGRFVLYCANHYALTPDEPKLVAQIVDALGRSRVLQSHQIVLRLHPMDDYDRWNDLLADCPSIRISYPWPHKDKHSLYWGEPSIEDLTIFSNTLRYCDAVFNIASTISIDAAILNKPVICVGFSSDSSNKYNSLYFDFHYSHHYAPIMQTGATPLSINLENLVALSEEAILHPDVLSSKRKQMVRDLCGETDGLASERIIRCLTEGDINGTLTRTATEAIGNLAD